MVSIMETMLNSGSIKHVNTLDRSNNMKNEEFVTTKVPILNAAFSGELTGGFTSGLTFFAGKSKTFKTMLGLITVKSYLDKYKDEDAICLFYDSEFGTKPTYIKSVGIDPSKILHIPIITVEELRSDISNRLSVIQKKDRVIIFIDSIGNLASNKETEDAKNEKNVADMTRAKVLKSLWRIVTPQLTLKDVPCIAINHTYETQEMYSKDIMSGGTGGIYSSETIFIITKAQEKDKENNIEGFKFTINIEKSRYVKEKSKFPLTVKFNGGVNIWSGLIELALEGNFVVKPNKGWYAKVDSETGEIQEKRYRLSDTNNREFWQPILDDPKFNEFVKDMYRLPESPIIGEDDQ